MSECFIIAEAGVNHNGSLKMALQLVDLAAACGADAVKFQIFNSELLATSKAPKAEYQSKAVPGDNSMLNMLKELQLKEDEYYVVKAHCEHLGIIFLSTPFDIESLFFLVEKLHLNTIKVGSGDLTNAPLLFEIARKQCSVILSTGMSTLAEIEDALATLTYGYLSSQFPTSYQEMKQYFYTQKPWLLLKEKVSLLHCVSNYPTTYDEVNLSILSTLKQVFGLKIGYSDHTHGIEVPIAAVALGAKIIEKHLTLDNTLPGPDHQASLEGAEFKQMVSSIRRVEKSIGRNYKLPTLSEMKMIAVARRGIVASKKIERNQIISFHDLAFKRPGIGLSPMVCWDLIGSKAIKTYEPDQSIELYEKQE